MKKLLLKLASQFAIVNLLCILLSGCLLLVCPVVYSRTHPQHKNELTKANNFVAQMARSGELRGLNDHFVNWAHLNGLTFIDKTHQFHKDHQQSLSNHFSVTMPMTLFPSPYPKELFHLAHELQPLMAKVHLRVSRDYEFIKGAMAEVAEADKTFIGELVNIMDQVKDNRRQSGMTLILQRSDYLNHQVEQDGKPTIQLKQIEVTSGTNAGQGDSPYLGHKEVLKKLKYQLEGQSEPLPEWFSKASVENTGTLKGQAEALYKTWYRFQKMHNDRRAVILMISAPKRRAHSHFEQLRWVQFELENVAKASSKGGRPHLIQLTIADCREKLTLDENHDLFWHGKKGGKPVKRRVAVAVYLDGYLPEHFTPADWPMRLQMEQSKAVMCPSVFVYFTSSKTVQQVLAEPGQLEHFFPEAGEQYTDAKAVKLREQLAKLRATFIEMWGLGKRTVVEDNELIKQAIENSGDYVLKENREGGKGNYFADKLVAKLKELLAAPEELGAFILQKKVRPFTVKNAFVLIPSADEKTGKIIVPTLDIIDVDTELSIFGSLLAVTNADEEAKGQTAIEVHDHGSSNPKASKHGKEHHGQHNGNDNHDNDENETSEVEGDQKILLNTVDGYLVRSKLTSKDMCTVSSGQGGFDSVVLFPQQDFFVNVQQQSVQCVFTAAKQSNDVENEEEAEAEAA